MRLAETRMSIQAESLHPRPDPADIAKLIERNLTIPTIPDVAARALRALSNPNSSAASIAAIIQEDQGLTARILQVANSAMYGLLKEVKSLPQASMLLGFEALKTIVITVSARGLYKRFGLVERNLWQHSVACALAAQHIADDRSSQGKEEAFVAGLMHDVGKVVMNNSERERYMRACQVASDRGCTDLQAEQEVFGFTHADVGSLLVKRWGLSEALEQAVFLHHEPELASSLAPEHEELVYVTHVADQICYHLSLGQKTAPPEDDTVDLEAFVRLGFEEEDLPPLCETIQERYRKAGDAL